MEKYNYLGELKMKLLFDVENKCQADPFIFKDENKLYIYVTGIDGVEAYESDDLCGVWKYKGIVCKFENKTDYWAPSVIKYDGKYYIYVSCNENGEFQEYMHVACSDSPLGPFKNEKCLYKRFSIDSHVVETDAGLFLWFAQDEYDGDRIGTRVFVDRLIDPYTPEDKPVRVIVPTFDEEIFTPQYTEESKWHTIEGAFWFREGDWQYVMYSGGCYQDDTYHIGYAVAKSDEADLTKVKFEKYTQDRKFAPVIIKNEFEEGTGHHSVIRYKGEYYAIYHGRDYEGNTSAEYTEKRTGRICRLNVKDGIITAERFEDHI